jgi:RNA polymerase sigma-70 factor (ECF subfamily)
MPNTEKQIDQQLIKQIKAGDNSAFNTLFRKHYAYLCMVVLRMTQSKEQAEDIVQEVFLEVWRKKKQLDIKTAVKSYLHRAAVNKTLNKIRDKKFDFDQDEEKLDSMATMQSSPLQKMQGEELQSVIKTAYESLPEKCRIVFSMVKYEAMSYKETAEKLEISVKTVENQMSKALRIMREAINKYKEQ